MTARSVPETQPRGRWRSKNSTSKSTESGHCLPEASRARRRVRQPIHELGHFRVVMADDVRALVAHHALRVRLAPIDRSADSHFRGRLKRKAALLEDTGHELSDLRTELIVGHGLPQEVEELLVRALEASEEFVSNERGSEIGIGDIGSRVRFAHLEFLRRSQSITALCLKLRPSIDVQAERHRLTRIPRRETSSLPRT